MDAHSFEYSEQDFLRVRSMVRNWMGISINDSKRSLVYNRLACRLREQGQTRFDDYLDLAETDACEREKFINALTTNLTSFFREAHHFPTLADHLQRLPPGRRINIWCSAASTGEEPYSIAMTAIEALGDAAAKRVRIIASDLDTQALAHGRNGIYRLSQVENLGRKRLARFFLKGCGRQEGYARVKPEVQSLINFQQINLLDAQWPVKAPLDAIFCRNVMIYFDKEMQLSVPERFAPLLHPKALLFIGHSESLTHATHLFRLHGKTVYCPNARNP